MRHLSRASAEGDGNRVAAVGAPTCVRTAYLPCAGDKVGAMLEKHQSTE